MNDGVTYKNKSYSIWNAIYIFFIVSTIVVPLLTAILIFLKEADITSALQTWVMFFLILLLACIVYSRGTFNLVPLWIKKDGNLLILHYHIKLIFWSVAKEISLDIRTIERMDFIEPKNTIGAHPAVGIYTKHNQIIRIGVDKEIFEMLKDLYFSMQGVDNPNKVVQ
jgi:membrane protease YdiL (CAAX protease family)